jgi:hypothetical protein
VGSSGSGPDYTLVILFCYMSEKRGDLRYVRVVLSMA